MKSGLVLPSTLRRASRAVFPWHRQATRIIASLDTRALTASGFYDLFSGALADNRPFLCGRFGGTESEGLKNLLAARISLFAATRPDGYSRFFKKYARPYSGISWRNPSDLDAVLFRQLAASLDADVLTYGAFAPGSLGLTKRLAETGTTVAPHSALDPWASSGRRCEPWTKALAGKKVLVIHPFVRSIESQFLQREKISVVKDFLPEFELITLRPPVGFLPTFPEPWEAAFHRLVDSVHAASFDVALVGAGAFGLPVAHEIKRRGRLAVHIGGALQLYFGISGSRWKSGYSISSRIDHTWIQPLSEDLSGGIESVERGAYT